MITITVELQNDGDRLDAFLASCTEYTRTHIKKLITDGEVTVNGDIKKPSFTVSVDDEICFNKPEPKIINIEPRDIPIDILYEDNDVLIVNKPKGMVVHPANGHFDDTLVNAVMFHCRDSLSGINGALRPGIVHRIDRDTTGALVICKNDNSHVFLASQIAEHSVTRRYRGIVSGGSLPESGRIEGAIGRDPKDRKRMAINEKNGKPAVTNYRLLSHSGEYSYVEFELETGRTHQIRVHMASIGHPLLGDEVYGPRKCPFKLQGQTLHAMVLGFVHPTTGEYMEFEAPLPEYFMRLLNNLSL